MKPIVNSQITIADCTFRNIIAPGELGIPESIFFFVGLDKSTITVTKNSIFAEIDDYAYGEMFIAEGRWYDSNMTISDNTANFVTLSDEWALSAVSR